MNRVYINIKYFLSKDKKRTNLFFYFILSIAIMIAFLGFFRDFNNNIAYGGVDLRSNVIGARLMLRGIDPYTYVWKPGDSELFLHPNYDNSLPLSHITMTPTVLAVYLTTANLPYALQQKIWLIVQWILLLSSIYLLSKCTDSSWQFKLIWILGLVFISASFFWRLHAERNKLIIFFVFLYSFSYWLNKRSFKYKDYFSGFLLGFVTMLRPSYIFASVPFLIYRRWKIIIGMVIGILSGFFIPVIFNGISVWFNYLHSMQYWSDFYIGKIPHIEYDYIRTPIEGVKNLYLYAILPGSDTSLIAIVKRMFGVLVNPLVCYILLIITLGVMSFILVKFKLKNNKDNKLINLIFLFGIFVVFIMEIFLPAQRYDYYNVIWLPIIALIIVNYKSVDRFFNWSVILIFITFISNTLYFSMFKFSILIGFFALLIYIIISIVYIYKQEYNEHYFQS